MSESQALARVSATEQWLSEQSGVQIAATPNGKVISIPPELGQRVNLLMPATQVVQVDANYSPMPRLVRLSLEEHTYKESGKWALTAKALSLIADASGIQFLAPHVDYMGGAGVAFTAMARRRGPDGTWEVRTATKSALYAVETRTARRERKASIAKWGSPLTGEALEDELDKHVDYMLTHLASKVETKAMNRVIRSWSAVKNVYVPEELRKPFLCLSWVMTPDYSSPHVREVMALNHDRGMGELYAGPGVAVPATAIRDLTDEPEEIEATAIDVAPEQPEVLPSAGVQDPWPEAAQQPAAGAASPPRPESFVFTQGPYKGQGVEVVVEDEEGRAWLAERVPKMRPGPKQDQALAWLSFAQGAPVAAQDCAALADRLRGLDSL